MTFQESDINSQKKCGSIEVICGSMFSGKTEELIRRLKRATIAKQKVEIFKPSVDNRYSTDLIVSHDSNQIPSTPVDSSGSILLLTGNVDVVGIDEGQFFDEGLIEVCTQLANQGLRIIVAGLDMDYSGKPFGPIPALCAVAENVTKVHAVCVYCGSSANYSHRIVKNENKILIGEMAHYEPLCRTCFIEVQNKKNTII